MPIIKYIPLLALCCTWALAFDAHRPAFADDGVPQTAIVRFSELKGVRFTDDEIYGKALFGESGGAYLLPVTVSKSVTFEMHELPAGYTVAMIFSRIDDVSKLLDRKYHKLDTGTLFESAQVTCNKELGKQSSGVVMPQTLPWIFFDDGLGSTTGRHIWFITKPQAIYRFELKTRIADENDTRPIHLLLMPIVPSGLPEVDPAWAKVDPENAEPLKRRTLSKPFPFEFVSRHEYSSQLFAADDKIDRRHFLLTGFTNSRTHRVDIDILAERLLSNSELEVSYDLLVRTKTGLPVLHRTIENDTKLSARQLLPPDRVWKGQTLEFYAPLHEDWKHAANTGHASSIMAILGDEYVIELSNIRIGVKGAKPGLNLKWRLAVRD